MPDVIDNVKVGSLIKKLLKERNMTQEQLANTLNISKSAVSQNLNGKSSFDIQNLIRISELFNISLDELISQKSGGDRSIVSEYERLVKKDVEALKHVPAEELNVKEPDLYGKTLVDYVIEYNQVEMFEYLDRADVQLYNERHHQARRILLKVIVFMLEKNLDGVEKYIFDYTRLFGAFDIPDDDTRAVIMKLLERENKQPLVERLMTSKVPKPVTYIKVIPYTQHLRILTKRQWIEHIAMYRMTRVLKTYLSVFDLLEDYAYIIKCFTTHRFIEGCRRILDAVPKKPRGEYELYTMGAQKSARAIAALNDRSLFEIVVEKGLYSDIDALVATLIERRQSVLYEHCLNSPDLEIDYVLVLRKAVEQGDMSLLRRHIEKLTQDEKNQLLAKTDAYDVETMEFLLGENAQFVSKYHNTDTFTKINQVIRHLLKRREGEKNDD